MSRLNVTGTFKMLFSKPEHGSMQLSQIFLLLYYVCRAWVQSLESQQINITAKGKPTPDPEARGSLESRHGNSTYSHSYNHSYSHFQDEIGGLLWVSIWSELESENLSQTTSKSQFNFKKISPNISFHVLAGFSEGSMSYLSIYFIFDYISINMWIKI